MRVQKKTTKKGCILFLSSLCSYFENVFYVFVMRGNFFIPTFCYSKNTFCFFIR